VNQSHALLSHDVSKNLNQVATNRLHANRVPNQNPVVHLHLELAESLQNALVPIAKKKTTIVVRRKNLTKILATHQILAESQIVLNRNVAHLNALPLVLVNHQLVKNRNAVQVHANQPAITI
jgi:hypothetical protein